MNKNLILAVLTRHKQDACASGDILITNTLE
jgi:hypothetical protein